MLMLTPTQTEMLEFFSALHICTKLSSTLNKALE